MSIWEFVSMWGRQKKKKSWIWVWFFEALKPESAVFSISRPSASVFVEGFCFKPPLCHRKRHIKAGKGQKGVWEKGKWGEKPNLIRLMCVQRSCGSTKGNYGWRTCFPYTVSFKHSLDNSLNYFTVMYVSITTYPFLYLLELSYTSMYKQNWQLFGSTGS